MISSGFTSSLNALVPQARYSSTPKSCISLLKSFSTSHKTCLLYTSQAAENGKQVSVLVELKARFDEENNIVWAKKLEKAGCHVIYGLVGLKTHSKITLVVRREETGIRRYVHLATGNYNDSTAKLLSLIHIC